MLGSSFGCSARAHAGCVCSPASMPSRSEQDLQPAIARRTSTVSVVIRCRREKTTPFEVVKGVSERTPMVASSRLIRSGAGVGWRYRASPSKRPLRHRPGTRPRATAAACHGTSPRGHGPAQPQQQADVRPNESRVDLAQRDSYRRSIAERGQILRRVQPRSPSSRTVCRGPAVDVAPAHATSRVLRQGQLAQAGGTWLRK